MMEKMVRGNLLRNGDSHTLQLIKSGRLAAAAIIVLKARRRMVSFIQLFFWGFVFLGLGAHALVTVVSQRTGQTSGGMLLGMLAFLALTQLACVVSWRSSLERLETMLYVWLQETPESEDVDRAELVTLLTTMADRM